MSKETFIVRTEWMSAIMMLDDHMQAAVFRNIYFFNIGRKCLINMDIQEVRIVTKLIFGDALYEDKPTIEAEYVYYETIPGCSKND